MDNKPKRQYSKAFKITSENPFEVWLTYVGPQFSLTKREIRFGGLLLKYYKEIESKIVNKADLELINSTLFSQEYKRKVKDEAGLTDNYYDVLLNKLRNHNCVKNNKLNPKIVPEYIEGTNMLGLLLIISK